MLEYAIYSDVGGRAENEDAVLLRSMDADRLCVVLADGLGGHGGGKQASRAAAERICGGWDGDASPDALRALTEKANSDVLAMQTSACQMKTTVVALAAARGRFAWAYAGDSRLYYFANGVLRWQTRDHSVSQMAALMGQITPDQIRFHEDRSRIYRCLGQEGGEGADAGELAPEPGQAAFLLCSDGFWEYVYEREMEETLRAAASPEDWLDRMRALHRERVPADNDNNSAAAIWTAV